MCYLDVVFCQITGLRPNNTKSVVCQILGRGQVFAK
ncbi:unnamed protein product [Linum tenue]|uniref:Uncharacterized protein n=1 Tax=Linum tenue TaxID=586396 RepID=A0AAV0NQ35_9ROSI|nr:unnamed protein product [Linum tenue]